MSILRWLLPVLWRLSLVVGIISHPIAFFFFDLKMTEREVWLWAGQAGIMFWGLLYI